MFDAAEKPYGRHYSDIDTYHPARFVLEEEIYHVHEEYEFYAIEIRRGDYRRGRCPCGYDEYLDLCPFVLPG